MSPRKHSLLSPPPDPSGSSAGEWVWNPHCQGSQHWDPNILGTLRAPGRMGHMLSYNFEPLLSPGKSCICLVLWFFCICWTAISKISGPHTFCTASAKKLSCVFIRPTDRTVFWTLFCSDAFGAFVYDRRSLSYNILLCPNYYSYQNKKSTD